MATEPPTEPSAWAMERTRRVLGITSHDAGCGCAVCELDQKDVAIALDAARTEGSQEGINSAAKLVVRREDGTIYIGGVGLTPDEVGGLARLLIAEERNARGWIARKNQASKLESEVVQLEASGLTHVVAVCGSYGILQATGRRDGLPVFVVCRVEKPAHYRSQVGEGPAVEWRAYRGRKWRPMSELQEYDHVNAWRLAAQ